MILGLVLWLSGWVPALCCGGPEFHRFGSIFSGYVQTNSLEHGEKISQVKNCVSFYPLISKADL